MIFFLLPRPLVDSFSYRVSTVLNVVGDSFVINNVGPISSIPQFLHECPRYHSSCQSHSSPAVLADAGDILAHPPAYKINKTHYLTVKPAFRQSLTDRLSESLSGLPVTRTALLSYSASASCLKAALIGRDVSHQTCLLQRMKRLSRVSD